jgi:Ion channel
MSMPGTNQDLDRAGWRPGKFFYLFLAQILLLALFPYLEQPGLPVIMFRLLGAFAFMSAVYAFSDKPVQWITALCLMIPAALLNTLFVFRPERKFGVPALISTILFLSFTIISLLRAVVRSQRITHDTIYGSLNVYLLMALAWGTAYLLLETLQPGALSIDAERHPNHHLDWFDCMFYSFVTLTTIGYGDIVPITGQARSLSILEAVSGVMYVAVLIARLVGLQAAARSAPDQSNGHVGLNPEDKK